MSLDFPGITHDEIYYRVWKSSSERDFHIFLDRDLRNCIAYAEIMGFQEGAGGAMFELSPMEIAMWEWEEALGVRHS